MSNRRVLAGMARDFNLKPIVVRDGVWVTTVNGTCRVVRTVAQLMGFVSEVREL